MTMRIRIDTTSRGEIKAETVVIPITRKGGAAAGLPSGLSALDRRMGGRISDALASGDFKAADGERLAIYGPRDGATAGSGSRTSKKDSKAPKKGALVRCILLGVGEADDLDADRLRTLGGRIGRETRQSGFGHVAVVLAGTARLSPERSAALIAEGAVLGAYRFDRYRTTSNDEGRSKKSTRLDLLFARTIKNLAGIRAGVKDAVTVAECQVHARDLSNEPPNSIYPESLARETRRMAREVGLRCQVMAVPELERRGMGAILAVGKGSARPPRMIVLEHGATKSRKKKGTLAMIGKGITFDSGGLSLKPAGSMPEMKHDMSGAASVIGAMRAIALLDLPIHVVAIVAAAENMPGGLAYRPSDIIESASGQTIEIVNTDAEGRLVMADALHYAVETFKPDAMIDIATLTGAAMMAFGPWATAGLGNDDALLDELQRAGDESGETVWPMPLLDAHEKAMRSSVADWKNAGGRSGGVSTAAAFLRGFVGETPWVHLDIAGSGMTETSTPLHIGGATGVGVRMLTEWVSRRCA
jgi:leucyl aminopeptidase